MRRFIVLIATGVLVLGACGSDSSSELSADQEQVVDKVMEASAAEGLVLDEQCVRDVISQMPSEDAAILANSDPDAAVELSAEGEAIGDDLLTCVDREDLINALVDDLSASGAQVDRQCVADALEGVEPSELFGSSGEGPPEEVLTALEACQQG
jgi:hypothetical protein